MALRFTPSASARPVPHSWATPLPKTPPELLFMPLSRSYGSTPLKPPQKWIATWPAISSLEILLRCSCSTFLFPSRKDSLELPLTLYWWWCCSLPSLACCSGLSCWLSSIASLLESRSQERSPPKKHLRHRTLAEH